MSGRVWILSIITISLSPLFSYENKFSYSNSTGNDKISLSHSPEFSEISGGYIRLVKMGQGHTTEVGMPELPIFSTFYQVDPSKTYDFELEILDSYIIEDINILPHQGMEKWEVENVSLKNEQVYSSATAYPEKNMVVSNRDQGRGIEFVSIQLVPYIYYPADKRLEVFSQVDIHVTETGENQGAESRKMLRSRSFDQLYKSLIINFESSDRDEDYQQPAVLYICGSNSESNSDFIDLVNWREQRGYVVYTASLSETGSSSSSIKNYIEIAYNNFNPPPEFVTLVGDVGGNISVPTFYDGHGHDSYGNYCEGDHPYTQLEGSDLVPEVLIGRMSVRSNSDIERVVAKIIYYEKAENLASTEDYYERAAMAGDPSSSGNSVAITKEYVAETLQAHGFRDVRLKTSGSSWSSWMRNQLEDGVLYFNYRGYLGMSGFDTNDVDNASAGEISFATILTCGTGSFAEHNTTMSEAFFRGTGTASNPRGSVAAIGTATWNTHTLFNNIVDMGIYDGLFADQVQTAGAALASGKLALLNTYPDNPDDWVGAFTQWNNLIGDAATHLWTDTPTVLSVSHESDIPAGTNFIDVFVQDESGNYVENARVTLWNALMPKSINFTTDDMGNVTIDLTGLSFNDYTITVTKNNYQPYSGFSAISLTGEIINVSEQSILIEDDSENGDGILNPGEMVGLSIPLQNYGTENITGVSATLSTTSELVNISSGTIQYGDIDVGEFSTSENFIISLSSSAVQSENLGLRLTISDNASNEWESEIHIDVVGSLLLIDSNQSNENVDISILIHPGTSSFDITLYNAGEQTESDIFAELSNGGNDITINDGSGTWSELSPGQSASSSFQITTTSSIIGGTILPLILHIQSADGYDRIETLNVKIGSTQETDPLGPDEYGYYIYDIEDTMYDSAPIYDWIEIDSDLGGNGTDLNLSYSGNGNWSGNGPIAHVDLPFTFTFYGIDYEEITVCTNGWIAFGHSDMEAFRNYPIPGAGGPSPMVAAFWDDLKTSNSGDVFTYFDSINGYFIIEWSGMRTYNNNDIETFQIILYNVEDGDGDIKIQYKVFNNTSSFINQYPPIHGQYATIGIENHLGDIGLQYTFNNTYPEAAATLQDGSALFITNSTGSDFIQGDLNDDGTVNILDVVLLVNIVLGIEDFNPAGDMNTDGLINVLDVVILVNAILNPQG